MNLYAYCLNNPVMYTDPDGDIALLTIFLIIIGASIGAGYFGSQAYNVASSNGATGWELAGWTALGMLGGGLLGGFGGYAIGGAIPLLGTFFGSTAFTIGVPTSLGSILGFSSVAVSWGAVSLVGAGTLAGLMMMSLGADRFKPKDGRRNTIQNDEFERIADEYGLNKSQRQRVHQKISKKGYGIDKIREVILKMLGLR